MNYLDPTLANALEHFNKLQADSKPIWGSMTPIGMVEHVTDSVQMAQGKLKGLTLQIPEDKVPKAQLFLHSEHPLPKNFKAPYGNPDEDNRNNTLEDAIKEFELNWMEFEQHYTENPEARNLHPTFGHLNHAEWLKLHSKHLTHHLQQFGLIPS